MLRGPLERTSQPTTGSRLGSAALVVS